MFGADLYVRISRNLVRVKNLKSGAEASAMADQPFSSVRLLVGDFAAAQQTLKAALAQAGAGSFLAKPSLLMHPLELVEGGLSQIEERVLMELAMGAGARRAVVFVGPELSDGEVAAKLKGQ